MQIHLKFICKSYYTRRWAKPQVPYRLTAAGFPWFAPEPYLHLSMYTALDLSTLRIGDCFVAFLTHNQRLTALFQHKLLPWFVAGEAFQAFHLVNHNREFIFTAQLTVPGHMGLVKSLLLLVTHSIFSTFLFTYCEHQQTHYITNNFLLKPFCLPWRS